MQKPSRLFVACIPSAGSWTDVCCSFGMRMQDWLSPQLRFAVQRDTVTFAQERVCTAVFWSDDAVRGFVGMTPKALAPRWRFFVSRASRISSNPIQSGIQMTAKRRSFCRKEIQETKLEWVVSPLTAAIVRRRRSQSVHGQISDTDPRIWPSPACPLSLEQPSRNAPRG